MPPDDVSLLPSDPPFQRQTAPGAMPGTVISPPDAMPSQLHVICYSPTELHEETLTDLSKLMELVERWPVTWLNVDGLGDAKLLEQLAGLFGIHPLSMEDVVHVHQRPKVENYDDYIFVVSRMIEEVDPLSTDQTSLFIGKSFLLSFQERPGDCLDPVRERLRKKAGRIRQSGPDYLAYAILDATLDAYFPLVERYGDRLDELDDIVTDSPTPRVVSELHHLRGNLLQVRKTMWAQRDALNELIRNDCDLVHSDTRIYLRDCVDHTAQILDVVETYREICADLRDYYLSKIGHRTNQVMKVLTIISTIFLPLSFIAGVYGMNFDTTQPLNMPELRWAFGYPFALGLMSATTIGLLVYIYRRGWFDS